MKPSPTDINALPHFYHHLMPLTGLTAGQVHTIYLLAHRRLPPRSGRPWSLPLSRQSGVGADSPARQPHYPGAAALFGTSQSTVDPVRHHLIPLLAQALRPESIDHSGPWIIDGTLIPVHDQSITAPSKNYRRSINTQIIISAETRHLITVGQCWPGNRNDVIVARHTIAHLLTGQNVILGDGGYRGIKSITTPRRDHTGRIIHDDDYRLHRRIRARVEHVIARLKDWQIGLPLRSWRPFYAAAGWSAASLSYWIGDINAAELWRRRVL